MDPSIEAAAQRAAEAAHHRKTSPRSDLFQSIAWVVLGVATVIGSWRMDRLKNQDINPYTVPGLLPGLLGIGIVFFGLLMVLRSLRRNALAPQPKREKTAAEAAADSLETRRMWTVLALCVGFAAGLVGHGPPFWAAAALFITIAISVLQFQQRKAANESKRGIVIAAVTGILAGIIITLVFQEFFLVRLP